MNEIAMTSDTINDDKTIAGNGEGTLLAGRYRIVRQLGVGGMGNVWLAEDMQLDNKQFAIKMLPSILVRNKRAYRQLKDEALVAMRLVHPNIVQIRAFEENNGNPFLVMDYIDGQTLDDYLAEHGGDNLTQSRREAESQRGLGNGFGGGLPEEDVVRILKPIAAALDYAHGEGVVHRDVKPANVMIRTDGHPFILDFGIAREIQETLTRVTGKLSSGTLLYMSPEQLNGEKPSPTQDVYSFAATVYECLKGEPPFVRGAIEDQIKNKLPDPLPVGRGILSVPLAASIMVGLAKKAKDRPRNCAAVLEGDKVVSRRGAEAQRSFNSCAESVGRGAPTAPQGRAGSPLPAEIGRARSPSGPQPQGGVVASGSVKINVPKSDWPYLPPDMRPYPGGGAGRGAPTAPKTAPDFSRAERVESAGLPTAPKTDAAGRARSPSGPQRQASKEGGAWKMFLGLALLGLIFAGTWIMVDRVEETSGTDMPNSSPVADPFVARTPSDGVPTGPTDVPTVKGGDSGMTGGGTDGTTAKADEGGKHEGELRKAGEEFTINEPYGLNLTMKWCPAGTFTMGSPPTEEGRCDNERQHEVTLTKGFWMGQTEVTQGQWKKIMGGETVVDLARKGLQDDTLYNIAGKKQTLREFWGMSRDADPMRRCGDLNDNIPVYNDNWNEAVEFCRRLTQRERAGGRIPDGYEYRLPTEAEWEYACRAGTTESLPNGRDIRILGKHNAPALDDIAWYGGNSSVGFNGRGGDTSNWPEKQYSGGRAWAREVKGKQPNRWGLYDMIGNVWEWCSDRYGDYPYGSANDPTGAATGAFRVFRGGSWYNFARICRSAGRAGSVPGCRRIDLGFRVALAPMLPEEYRKAVREELQKANVSARNAKGAHDKVQLWAGGPYWATTNIGAERPEDYGYYFWWGDTIGYRRVGDTWVATDGSRSNFSFTEVPTYKKNYDALRREGWIMDEGALACSHDAAQRYWGGNWRMPTKHELDELKSNCVWAWKTMNGVNGYEVRGRGGYASNSIFLPCAGYGGGASLGYAGSYGYYWSSVPISDNDFAWSLNFDSGNHYTYCTYRYLGQSIRPVQGFTR